MKDIKEIYKKIVLNGYYDEAYGMKPEIIDNKTHGVCIDFSRELIELLRKEGYAAGLISTLNDDGFLHAAVIYKDLEEDIVNIADPVTDIRRITGLSDEEINSVIEEIMNNKNWKRDLREYIKEFGIVTAYNDDLSKSMEQIRDKEELEAIPAINETISKKIEPVQTITSLEHVKSVADGPTLLACQALYKKGISTYCSNYTPNGAVSVNINYNSLSPENKQKLLELKDKYPDNFYFQISTGFYGELGHDDEIANDKAMEVVFGFKNSSEKSIAQINLEMFNLISNLKKQEYLEGSFTREQMLDGKHLLDTTEAKLGINMHCKSNDTNTNEEIATNEGFIYSKKYDRFFKDMVTKSRYIESLYRNEHDLRTEEEIAQSGEAFYDSECHMFFESEQELLNYKQEENFKKWSEGNDYLYKLFKSCYNNGILTAASCGGHSDRQAIPFISIIIDEKSLPYVKNIIGEIANMDNSWIAYHIQLPFEKGDWNKKNISKSIQIYGTNSNCCELFYRINKAIESKSKLFMDRASKSTQVFIEKLNEICSMPSDELYNLIVNNGGEIVNYLGEKDRILNEINSGRHQTLQTEFYEQRGDYPLVSSADIVEADMNRKISHSKIQSIKIFFENILNKITGKGER